MLRLCCHFKSSRKLPGLTAHTVSSQRSGFQEYELLTSITVDTVAVHSMQWAGPGLSTGSHVERKEGIPPPPHSPPTPPAVHSLVNRNGPQNKNQTNQRSPMIVLEMKELSSWLRRHQGERLLFLSATLLLSSWTP